MFRELNFVLTFIRDFIVGNDLVSKYSQLAGHYSKAQETATAGSGEGLRDEVTTLQKTIIDIQNSVNFEIWTAPKKKVLERMKATDFIGPQAVSNLTAIINDDLGNPVKISQGITAIQGFLSELLTRTNQAIAVMGLGDYKDEVAEDRQILEISFEDGSVMKNFWDIKKNAEEWNYIIKTFTRLTGQKYESVEIISQVSGSDFSTTLTAIKDTAEIIIKAAGAVVAIKTVKDIFFKKKQGVEKLQLPNAETVKAVIKDLEIERDGEYKKKIGEFSVEIVKSAKGKGAGENDNELANAVGIALDKMTSMLELGAKVVDPTEILPVVTETAPVLGANYASNKLLSDEVKELQAVEVQKMLEAKHKEMLKDVDEKKPKEPKATTRSKDVVVKKDKKNSKATIKKTIEEKVVNTEETK